MQNDDAILLRRLKEDSDMDAFEVLFRKYAAALCAYAYTILRDQQASEDVVQHVFTRLLTLKNFKGINSNLKAYLYMSVYHRSLRVQNEEKSRIAKRDSYLYTSSVQEELDIDLEKEQIKDELVIRRIVDLITEMPAQRSKALRLVYWEGNKYNEAAASMGISINSLKTHLKEGLKSLRKSITY